MNNANAVNDLIRNVKFIVKKINYSDLSSGYRILTVNFTEYNYEQSELKSQSIKVVGTFVSVKEGDEFEAKGVWRKNKYLEFEDEFAVISSKLHYPSSLKGIEDFLKNLIKGLGSATAKALVNEYKEDTLTILKEDYKNFMVVKGLGEKRAVKFHNALNEHFKFEEIALFLLQNNFKHSQVLKIYQNFGDNSIEEVKMNPYLIYDLIEVDFAVVDKMAKVVGYKYNDIERVKTAIKFYIRSSKERQGNLFTYKDVLFKNFKLFLTKYGEYKLESEEIDFNTILVAIRELEKDNLIKSETDNSGRECVYLVSDNYAENRIVDLLVEIVNSKRPEIATKSEISKFIEKYEKENNFSFANKQKMALYSALENNISILTGGPGTGKTQTINSIIQCILNIKPFANIKLCAPTGKASKRMSEVSNMEAKTIHRLIKLNPALEDEEQEIIDADFLVIDESSMIDAFVFYKLLDSVSPKTKILIVGDYNQLPSVGAGLILRDLIQSNAIATVQLDEIFRQAKESQIVTNSHLIMNGNSDISLNPEKDDFDFIESSDRLVIKNSIVENFNTQLQMGKSVDDIQVLTPVKEGDLGTIELNRVIQLTFNKPSRNKKEIRVNENLMLREGDKVIQTANNYDLEVFNGETGIVSKIERDGEDYAITIDYQDRDVIYNSTTAGELLLAYVITIHKSQGSEFPVVIMPLSTAHKYMLNRNIVYTAWTRAKSKIVCVGDKDALVNAISKTDNTNRNSLIKEKLINRLGVITEEFEKVG